MMLPCSLQCMQQRPSWRDWHNTTNASCCNATRNLEGRTCELDGWSTAPRAFLAAQTIAGAVATATHGSTLMDGTMSNQVRSERHPRHLMIYCSSSQAWHHGHVMSSRLTIFYTPSIPQIRCVAADILWRPYSLPCLGISSSM
jgi:hypothetical protein